MESWVHRINFFTTHEESLAESIKLLEKWLSHKSRLIKKYFLAVSRFHFVEEIESIHKS